MGKRVNHPMQPVVSVDGVKRFKQNRIVRFLLDNGGIDMNQIAELQFPQDDRVQFAQLIGYSVSGLGELDYVPRSVVRRADAKPVRG